MTLNPATSRSGAGGGGLFDAYAYVRDEKANNTASGAFNSGAWRTRDLNTEVFDSAGFVALAANQFTLGAGTYYIVGRAPAYNVNFNKARLRNVTDGTTVIIGSNTWTQNNQNSQLDSWVSGRVTIGAAKAFELQHFCSDSEGTTGFGRVNNLDGTIEVYAEVWIWREA